jgi:hypothetical protein
MELVPFRSVAALSVAYAVQNGFYSQGKDVADAPFGLDHTRRTRIGLQFAPQAQDLDVDAAIEDVFVYAGGLQQMLPREGTLRRFQERKQQAVFPFGQGNRIPRGIEQASAAALQPPAVKSVSAPLGIMGARGASHLVSPQNRADAGKQLPETERLGNVIVGTELEADDTVDFITAMPCGDDNRTSEWERISRKRSSPSSWPSRRSRMIRLGFAAAKWRLNSLRLDTAPAGTLCSSK